MPPNRPPLRQPLQTRRDYVPHPSECRGNAYSDDMRQLIMHIRAVRDDLHPEAHMLDAE